MGDREMVERLREQLYNTQEVVRSLEAECEELEGERAEKIAEFVLVDADLREKEDELKSVREEEASIQNDIDSLLGA